MNNVIHFESHDIRVEKKIREKISTALVDSGSEKCAEKTEAIMNIYNRHKGVFDHTFPVRGPLSAEQIADILSGGQMLIKDFQTRFNDLLTEACQLQIENIDLLAERKNG